MKEEETVPFCHFSRVFVGTTLRDLKLSNEQQVLRNCKKIEYSELSYIGLGQPEFDLFCRDISKPKHCYQKYAHESCADSRGRWKCIVIRCITSKQKIVLYTAGHTYPLYAGICE